MFLRQNEGKKMIYGFDTEKNEEAVAALVVYAIYRSRNLKQFKVTIDMWDKIERFVKASAKRAKTIPIFIEKLKPKLVCHSISPRWMEVGIKNDIGLFSRVNKEGVTEYIEIGASNQREFMTAAVKIAEEKNVLAALYHSAAWIILLVRERLERERPQEKFMKEMEENEQ